MYLIRDCASGNLPFIFKLISSYVDSLDSKAFFFLIRDSSFAVFYFLRGCCAFEASFFSKAIITSFFKESVIFSSSILPQIPISSGFSLSLSMRVQWNGFIFLPLRSIKAFVGCGPWFGRGPLGRGGPGRGPGRGPGGPGGPRFGGAGGPRLGGAGGPRLGGAGGPRLGGAGGPRLGGTGGPLPDVVGWLDGVVAGYWAAAAVVSGTYYESFFSSSTIFASFSSSLFLLNLQSLLKSLICLSKSLIF